uniref:Disease resistance protein winged helix domain-containing protein n=1 Tax=Aegilops tauschii TaxID=37682 RepID=M8CSE4_AEGTA
MGEKGSTMLDVAKVGTLHMSPTEDDEGALVSQLLTLPRRQGIYDPSFSSLLTFHQTCVEAARDGNERGVEAECVLLYITRLLYLGMYPEDYRIIRSDLERQWMVEGFVSKENGQDVEKLARNYFNELVNRSLI